MASPIRLDLFIVIDQLRRFHILPSLLRKLSKALLVLTLALSLGVHWSFLQSVAWVGMVVSYAQDAPFKQALEMTFDGEHPCKLCKLVQEGKQSEKEQDVQKPVTKLDLMLVEHERLLDPPVCYPLVNTLLVKPSNRTEPPPTPPPRLA